MCPPPAPDDPHFPSDPNSPFGYHEGRLRDLKDLQDALPENTTPLCIGTLMDPDEPLDSLRVASVELVEDCLRDATEHIESGVSLAPMAHILHNNSKLLKLVLPVTTPETMSLFCTVLRDILTKTPSCFLLFQSETWYLPEADARSDLTPGSSISEHPSSREALVSLSFVRDPLPTVTMMLQVITRTPLIRVRDAEQSTHPDPTVEDAPYKLAGFSHLLTPFPS